MNKANERLRSFRISLNLTKVQMSEKLGYTLSLYEKVEDGRTGASAKFMHKFKTVFPNASIEFIFFN